MKILHINTYDTGGAANACLRIHLSLLDKGIDSKVLVLYKSRDIPEVYEFNYWDNTKNRLHRFIKRRIYKRYSKHMDKLNKFIQKYPVEIFTEPTSIFDITTHPLYKEADIIQLNWTAGFLDEPSFFAKNKKPVIWRMADLYACGGGNHYEKGFLFDDYKKLLDNNINIREKSIKNKIINIVAISGWTKQKVMNSKLLNNNPINVITNGINTDIFKPIDKIQAREQLKLPLDKKIILFGAEDLSHPRKGINLLLKSISRLANNTIIFCSFGNININDERIISLGPIKDEVTLSMLYSSADIFVMSSIEETFGQVIIESLSCGTPVVSFPNGGGLEAVIEGFNGILATNIIEESLTNAINKGLNTHFDRDMIRKDTVKRFNIEDKASQFIKLYKNLLNT